MKTLLILRHAKSSWTDSALTDHDRPLNQRGKRDAPRMGRLIANQGLHPDLILSSTAKRARSTARRVVEGGEFACPLQLLEEFYLAGPATYLAVLREQADVCQRILVIGHNPGLEELVELLSGREETLPTATLVQIELEIESWSEMTEQSAGQLAAVWRPKELAE